MCKRHKPTQSCESPQTTESPPSQAHPHLLHSRKAEWYLPKKQERHTILLRIMQRLSRKPEHRLPKHRFQNPRTMNLVREPRSTQMTFQRDRDLVHRILGVLKPTNNISKSKSN